MFRLGVQNLNSQTFPGSRSAAELLVAKSCFLRVAWRKDTLPINMFCLTTGPINLCCLLHPHTHLGARFEAINRHLLLKLTFEPTWHGSMEVKEELNKETFLHSLLRSIDSIASQVPLQRPRKFSTVLGSKSPKSLKVHKS